MAKDITDHDASTDLSSTFDVPRSSRLVVSLKWTDIVGGSGLYFMNQSNIDPQGADPVAAIPDGIAITVGSDTSTFEVVSPADKMEHLYSAEGVVISGTLTIGTKVLYTND